MGKSGLEAAMFVTCQMPSTEPGLKEMCLIPALVKPLMTSVAFSVLGMPAVTQKPSTGNPSFRISCHNGNWKPNCLGYRELRVIPTPGGILDWILAILA